MLRSLTLTALCLAATVPQQPNQPPAAEDSLEVRYCRAQLALAEAHLERVAKLNRKVARSVPAR